MLNLRKTLSLIFLALVVFVTCKHQPKIYLTGQDAPFDTAHYVAPPPAYDSVCFNTQILPLIMANCAQSGCHNATSHVEGLNLTSYSPIRSLAVSGSLLSYITRTTSKRMPPPPQPAMDTASINLIKRWIKEGYKNRICNPTACDTANVLYTTHIVPIVNTYCKGCHNSGNLGGGINLDNYASVKTQTQTGNLICAISTTSCKFMPQGGATLSACNIRKFKIWLAKSCPQ